MTVNLKSISHATDCKLVTDSGQFACSISSVFTSKYRFQHVTSGPRYSQSKEAERKDKTTKNPLTKATNLHLALLGHKSIPLRLAQTGPIRLSQMYPPLTDSVAVKSKEKERKNADQSH